MGFPIYLRFQNNKHFFKILSETEFEEITVIGEKYEVFFFKADIYPEKLRIQDMIKNEKGTWDSIDEAYYLKLRSKAQP